MDQEPEIMSSCSSTSPGALPRILVNNKEIDIGGPNGTPRSPDRCHNRCPSRCAQLPQICRPPTRDKTMYREKTMCADDKKEKTVLDAREKTTSGDDKHEKNEKPSLETREKIMLNQSERTIQREKTMVNGRERTMVREKTTMNGTDKTRISGREKTVINGREKTLVREKTTMNGREKTMIREKTMMHGREKTTLDKKNPKTPTPPGLGKRQKTFIRGSKSRQGQPQYISRSDCASRVGKMLEEMVEHHREVKERYERFLFYLPDFLSTLKLIKPLNLDRYASLADVIVCHDYLVHSQSIGKIVNTEIVTEFLAIVYKIQQESLALKEKVCKLSEQLHRYPDISEEYITYKGALSALDKIQQFEYDFTELPFSKTHQLSIPLMSGVMDNKLFSGLVCYIPVLYMMEQDVMEAIEGLWQGLKHVGSAGSRADSH